jgi:hypothetical protein
MSILDVEIPDELLSEIKELASRLYGDCEERSQAKVVESALSMRLLWFRLLNSSHGTTENEIEEPLVNWEFAQSPEFEDRISDITQWLFRR